MSMARRNFIATAGVAALATLATDSRGQTGGNRDAIGMHGTINKETQEIYLVGSLTDRDSFNTVIAVNLLNVPPGEWKFTKVEHNGQSKAWGLWALQLGYATRFNKLASPRCNYFTRFTFVDSRNCLVFDKGAVEPGQTLIKSWTMVHTEGPVIVLHYERPEKMGTPLSHEEIMKGWGNKSIDQVMNVTLQVIEN